MTSSSASSSSASSSPSSHSNSNSHYNYIPVPAAPPFSAERPFRILTPASVQAQHKRKRDVLDEGRGCERVVGGGVGTGAGVTVSVSGSSFGPTGKIKAKRPRIYNDNGDLLSAIHAACLEDAAVDFSGSYSVSGDPLSDKERVQSVTHDIWKATGYRFTVKDHPRTDRGHKTRLWCSQDAARRSKHRGPGDAPRISKQGDLFAKPRYACRSRLMISSIPDDEGATSTSTVTVRLHHYVRHEAYFDAVPPARAQGQQQQRTQTQTQQTQQQTQTQPAQTQPTQGIAPQFRTAITATLPPHIIGHLSAPPPPPPPPPPLHRREGEWDEVERPEREWEDDEPPVQRRPSHSNSHPHPPPNPHPHPHPHPHPNSNAHSHSHSHTNPPPTHSPPPPTSSTSSTAPPSSAVLAPPTSSAAPPPTPAAAPPLTPAQFQARMRAHIARIRDFCDGLEFQVQFNDHRMLAALERDAGAFLGLVDDCLRQEGRG